MRFQLGVAAVLQLGISLATGQLAYDANTNTIHCPEAKGAYCVDIGASKSASKLVHCADGVAVRTDDCNELLDGKPGQNHGAVCYQSSKEAGDAICLFNNEGHILVPHALPVTSTTEEVIATIMDVTSTSTVGCARTTTITVVDEDDDTYVKFANLEASTTTSPSNPTTVSFVSETFYTILPKPITSDEGRVTIANLSTIKEETKAKPTADALSLGDIIPDLISPEKPTIQTDTDTRSFTYLLPETPTSSSGEPTYTILPIEPDPIVSILSTADAQADHQLQTPAAVKTVTVYAGEETTTTGSGGAEPTETDDTANNAGEKHPVQRSMPYLFGILALAIAMF